MTKARVLLALLAIPVLFLTGCIRMVAEYEISSVDEIKVSMDFGMQNQAIEVMGSDAPDDMCADADFSELPGATAEPYTEEGSEGYMGCRVTATASAAQLNDGDTSIELVDGVWHFKQSGDTQDLEGMSASDAAEMFSDFRISVTFPGKVLTHNGSSTVSGTTVTWADPADLLSGEGLAATAEDGSGGIGLGGGGGLSGALPWVIGGVLVLLVAGGVVAFLLMRKKNAATPAGPTAGQPWDQSAGQPPAGQWNQPAPGQPGAQQPSQWGQQPSDQQWGQQPPNQQWGQQPPNQQWGQQPPQQPGGWGGPPSGPYGG